jgi:hypothetical protein
MAGGMTYTTHGEEAQERGESADQCAKGKRMNVQEKEGQRYQARVGWMVRAPDGIKAQVALTQVSAS